MLDILNDITKEMLKKQTEYDRLIREADKETIRILGPFPITNKKYDDPSVISDYLNEVNARIAFLKQASRENKRQRSPLSSPGSKRQRKY